MGAKVTSSLAATTDDRGLPATAWDIPNFIEHRHGDAYPAGSPISVKHVAYLYAYCRKHPFDIVARYPKTLSSAQLHIALAHYYLNRERIDAEIERDRKMNTRDFLSGPVGKLPGVSLSSLVEVSDGEGLDGA